MLAGLVGWAGLNLAFVFEIASAFPIHAGKATILAFGYGVATKAGIVEGYVARGDLIAFVIG